MPNNSSPCMTCALRVTSLHADIVGDAHADAVFREFKRHHNPKAFRVHDLTGPKEENATWYCVIGDDHFNKDNVKCPEWIPAINGITPSEALTLHRNKPVQKKWHEKTLWQFLMVIASGLIVAYFVFWFGWNGPKETSTTTTQKTSEHIQPATPTQKSPKKIPFASPPSKKSLKTIATSTINAQNSNIFIGSNTGTVNQTINNLSEPKPIPLRDRLISCLDEIDKRIILALHSGITLFKFKLMPYQLADLQKIAAEPDASSYIILKVQPGIIFRKTGNVTLVLFELKPALLQ